ncbi:MAG: outer membrane beta-barrel protein, partial [Planctomycetota bacterium]
YVAEPLAFDGLLSASEDDPAEPLILTGAYVIGYFSWAIIDDGNDFEGDMVLVGEGFPDFIVIPEFDDGVGFGVGLGYRMGDFALELNYQRTTHDADSVGPPLGDGVLNLLNIDLKYFFNPEERLQPNLLVGLAIPWLDVEDASIIPFGEVDDATYTGIGVSLGGGLSYYIDPKIALTVQGGYRFLFFTDVEGNSGQHADIEDELEAGGLFVSAGVSITF